MLFLINDIYCFEFVRACLLCIYSLVVFICFS